MTATLERFGRRFRRPAQADGFDRRLIVPMIVSSVLNPVNSSILAVSLVPIGIAFGAPPAQTAWLVSALYLATAIGQPVVGRLIDLYGPRRLYLAGAALTGIAGLLGLLAPALWVLVPARVILGFGTCAGYPASMYLIRSESERTGRDSPATVLTALSIASQTVIVLGPTAGGLLVHLGGWRATFAVNIPLALACLALGTRRLPRTPPARRGSRSGLDAPGIALFTVTLVALLLFLMEPAVAHWYLPVLAVVALAALVVRELRTAEPFVDVRLLGGNLPLVATYVRGTLSALIAYCFLYGFTQWLEDGRGLSAATAGLVLLPMSLAGIGVAALTGRRKGIRGKLVVGAIAQIAAACLLLTVHTSTTVWVLVAAVCIMGIPQGLNNLAIQNAVYYQAEPDRMASSAGLLRTFVYLGAIGSAAAGGALLTRPAGTAALHHLSQFMLIAAVLFLVLTLADRSLGRVGRSEAAGRS
ncbi:MFS transporter [Nocardia aurantia]|uniref:Putative multidrug resistance protein MdtD n=1 Tax=Nocardia aurantia TaxID=2585199 RepID=A0A7K0DU48_9NOCA|nr:MFS transporter [Nocardia aurantia]MQY29057.1 putative multidrug resistance protein MdtD [Nocardia aurantia]